jgi:hypothetical protein
VGFSPYINKVAGVLTPARKCLLNRWPQRQQGNTEGEKSRARRREAREGALIPTRRVSEGVKSVGFSPHVENSGVGFNPSEEMQVEKESAYRKGSRSFRQKGTKATKGLGKLFARSREAREETLSLKS